MAKLVFNIHHLVAVIPQIIISSIVLIVLLFVMLRFYPKITHIAHNIDPFFKWLYVITVCLSTWAMFFILINNVTDEYFLIPHFQGVVNDILTYILTIVYPVVLLSLLYLWKKDLWMYVTTIVLTILSIPFIFKLPGAPQNAYPSIISMSTYVVIILILNTVLFKFLNERFLMHVSFYGSLVVYFSFTGIIAANIFSYFL
jgi:hypothetical protein